MATSPSTSAPDITALATQQNLTKLSVAAWCDQMARKMAADEERFEQELDSLERRCRKEKVILERKYEEEMAAIQERREAVETAYRKELEEITARGPARQLEEHAAQKRRREAERTLQDDEFEARWRRDDAESMLEDEASKARLRLCEAEVARSDEDDRQIRERKETATLERKMAADRRHCRQLHKASVSAATDHVTAGAATAAEEGGPAAEQVLQPPQQDLQTTCQQRNPQQQQDESIMLQPQQSGQQQQQQDSRRQQDGWHESRSQGRPLEAAVEAEALDEKRPRQVVEDVERQQEHQQHGLQPQNQRGSMAAVAVGVSEQQLLQQQQHSQRRRQDREDLVSSKHQASTAKDAAHTESELIRVWKRIRQPQSRVGTAEVQASPCQKPDAHQQMHQQPHVSQQPTHQQQMSQQ